MRQHTSDGASHPYRNATPSDDEEVCQLAADRQAVLTQKVEALRR
jgi:hypothetical protein